MNRKKTADGILGAAVISCLLAAPFKEVNIWYAGLFHISFAAAVGGFADWFAVSSLFGKPLGILIVRTSLQREGTKSSAWRKKWWARSSFPRKEWKRF